MPVFEPAPGGGGDKQANQDADGQRGCGQPGLTQASTEQQDDRLQGAKQHAYTEGLRSPSPSSALLPLPAQGDYLRPVASYPGGGVLVGQESTPGRPQGSQRALVGSQIGFRDDAEQVLQRPAPIVRW